MNQPTPPDQACATLINSVGDDLGRIALQPDGTPRNLDSATAVRVLAVHSNLAIAAGLLAIADAIGKQPGSSR
ncbi:hypothetical protein [Nonomuraea sp. NPDC001636]|uniref:hypothetical protein n=1 Tax=Actinomycetes TaxID=1760 RepID=UPI00332A795C